MTISPFSKSWLPATPNLWRKETKANREHFSRDSYKTCGNFNILLEAPAWAFGRVDCMFGYDTDMMTVDVWYEPAPVPSRASPAPSRAPPESAQPSPVWTSQGPAQPSLVPSRASPGPAQPTQSQPLPPSHQEQHQHPTLSHQLPRELMDYYSGDGDGGEPQQLGRTRTQIARNQAGIDRPQIVNDGVAQLGRTRGQTAQSGGYATWTVVFNGCAEGYWSCTVPSSPTSRKPPLPSRPLSELLTPSSYSEALTDEYSNLWFQAMEKEYGGPENAGTFGAI